MFGDTFDRLFGSYSLSNEDAQLYWNRQRRDYVARQSLQHQIDELRRRIVKLEANE